MDNTGSIKHRGTPQGVLPSRKLLSRDINYLRDVALFWPFTLSSIFATGCAFSPPHRQLGLRFAGVAVAAILLARERLVLFFVALGFIALQGVIFLVIHQWSWSVFAAVALTGVPFLVANRYWRNPKFSYPFPNENEFGAVDILLSFASICCTLLLYYIVLRTLK